MSRTRKDKPWRLGGSKHAYMTSERGHGAFTEACRRVARHAANQALRTGLEPAPRHPAEHRYWD